MVWAYMKKAKNSEFKVKALNKEGKKDTMGCKVAENMDLKYAFKWKCRTHKADFNKKG